jgi:hypothetical protein
MDLLIDPPRPRSFHSRRKKKTAQRTTWMVVLLEYVLYLKVCMLSLFSSITRVVIAKRMLLCLLAICISALRLLLSTDVVSGFLTLPRNITESYNMKDIKDISYKWVREAEWVQYVSASSIFLADLACTVTLRGAIIQAALFVLAMGVGGCVLPRVHGLVKRR